MTIEAITSAVRALGSQTKLAKKLGCTPQNVQRMCSTGHVPAKHVLRIEAESGVSRCLLRPDLYPDPAPTLSERLSVGCQCEQSDECAVNPSSISRTAA
ncbi:helix-turn-helix domain-containing protein [Pseudomonas putida]|uniref:transcriptional regulator n=1 Tax=Pseudomonas putida TaxID=303 RepID=UPI0018AB918D|nr:YdaS family helix-turn-helix protein [Pseudomonas putida]MBF8651318.1 helix-turn-helix domain-containing protein [Pseudomonas putida]MBF8655014.1 helix-turn-helix domain-containing protein [Pseudomonas putida]